MKGNSFRSSRVYNFDAGVVIVVKGKAKNEIIDIVVHQIYRRTYVECWLGKRRKKVNFPIMNALKNNGDNICLLLHLRHCILFDPSGLKIDQKTFFKKTNFFKLFVTHMYI